ncbi:MAG: BREX-4 system phosphatase PglZ [Defluviitaleaceae bacterium]|nr:BREX-4 system phosphatase PglZ [Defluviitaleaceae bacterium]
MIDVASYLQSDIYTPFFLVVGDSDYIATKEKLSALGLKAVGVSKYCSGDRVPNIDRLFADLKSGKVKVLVGLGEYLALNGESTAYDTLSKLQDFTLDGHKAILMLRGVTDSVKKLQANDLRFDIKRVAYTSDVATNLSVTCVPQSFEMPFAMSGLKAVLTAFENGNSSRLVAKTKRTFPDSLIDVYTINTAYDGIKHWLPTFMLPRDMGSDEMWTELMTALNATGGNVDALFGNFGFAESLLDEFDVLIQGTAFKNWLYFIALKTKTNEMQNSYLRYVLDKTEKIEDLKENIVNAIIGISHTDKRFERFFKERKELVAKISEADIAAFVRDNKINLAESLYKLTDQTPTEREELIVLFGSLDKKTVLNRIEAIYPVLFDYLYFYSFSDPKVDAGLCKLFTDYFDKYKWQKVQNRIDDDFVDLVEELAQPSERKYNLLRSRNDIINGIDKTRTKLYWLDALGIEFLGFIQATCKKLGLALRIHIGRSELPTITTINKDFFVNWPNDDKEADGSLDKVKHQGSEGGYNYQTNRLPIHLARELEIIKAVLHKIAVDLAKHTYGKVLLVSDHGASRLAVIKEQEEKYDTDTSGEHSGRCCKVFPDYELLFATEENGYLVLANYGRFKGSRKANVEVHGGASLEEVLVPIIEITLAKPNIKVQLVNDVVYADYKNFAEFEIFSNVKLDNVKVIIDGKSYAGVKKDDSHYMVATDIKRARTYQADIFDGDSLVGTVSFTAQGKNKSNDDFDL